jgi:alpha-glucoside transport system permease protein
MATNAAVAPKASTKKRPVTLVPEVMKQGQLTPWLYLAPAVIVMFIFIVYPMINTAGLSFQNADGTGPASTMCREGQPCWGIFENYRYALTNEMDFTGFNPLTTGISLLVMIASGALVVSVANDRIQPPAGISKTLAILGLVLAFIGGVILWRATNLALWSSFWQSSYGNNIKWMIFMVTGTVSMGLIIALLSDRVKYEPLAKAIIFMPMAISFVGAGIIWKFVYDYGSSRVQIGALNAIVQVFGGEPIAWLSTPQVNTIALIVVGIWMWTGFCMTILSAALKGIPGEVLEAARVDGAAEWTVFWQIMVPMIMPTIVVVSTVMVINVLKIFDIVYVMTGGNYGTEVIANRMYTEMYTNQNAGRGTAVAIVLILLLIPFIYINIKRFQEQEAVR